jgi:hypothetical protein
MPGWSVKSGGTSEAGFTRCSKAEGFRRRLLILSIGWPAMVVPLAVGRLTRLVPTNWCLAIWNENGDPLAEVLSGERRVPVRRE